MPATTSAPPILLLLTGPSGVGKTTLCGRLLEAYRGQIERVVTATTREPREGERDGVDYHFLGSTEFEQRVESGGFLEHAKVHDHAYGTPLASVRGPLARGQDLLLSVDVQGAESIRKCAREDEVLASSLVTVFVMPRDLDQLLERLRGRGTDDDDVIRRRVERARDEMSHWSAFHFRIVSEDRESDFRRFEAVYLAEKCRVRGT